MSKRTGERPLLPQRACGSFVSFLGVDGAELRSRCFVCQRPIHSIARRSVHDPLVLGVSLSLFISNSPSSSWARQIVLIGTVASSISNVRNRSTAQIIH